MPSYRGREPKDPAPRRSTSGGISKQRADAEWLQEREPDAAVLKISEHDRHVLCIAHLKADGHRICVLRGQDPDAVLAEAMELYGHG